jgi:menaquinone-dependent protoporphyrinogen oxidase
MMRVLVAYASKNGSTAEIAQAITKELERHGFEVDCLEAAGVRQIES